MFKWLKKKPESNDGDSENVIRKDFPGPEQNDTEPKSNMDEARVVSARSEEQTTVGHRHSENVPAVDVPNSSAKSNDGRYNDNVPVEELTLDEDKKPNSEDGQLKASSLAYENSWEKTVPGESFQTKPSTMEKVDLDDEDYSHRMLKPHGIERREFTFNEAVDLAGYGGFQKTLTMFIGLFWFAYAFQVLLLTILADVIACDWYIYLWQEALLTTNMFIGMIFGGPVFGIVADTFGRRTVVKLSTLFAFIFGALCAVSPNIYTLLTMRFFLGFTLGSFAQGVTLCIEYYPSKYRGIAGFYINYYWSFGSVFLIVTSWLLLVSTRGWRYLLFAVSLPSLLVFFSTRWYPESVRYFLVTNQYKSAVKQLRRLMIVNKVTFPPGGRLQKIPEDDQKGEKRGSKLLRLLQRPHTITTLLFWYIWFAIAFQYYGLALVTPVVVRKGTVLVSPETSVKSLERNLSGNGFFSHTAVCRNLTSANYLDLLWTSGAEVPGVWIFSLLVPHIPRRRLLGLSVLINTVLVPLLLINFSSTLPGKLILFLSRANIGGVFQLIMIMTSEAFPTVLRATSMGMCHAFAMLGAAVVPFAVRVLIIEEPVVAVCLMSSVVFLCAIAAVFLPREMKERRIKDLSEEYEKIEKKTPMI